MGATRRGTLAVILLAGFLTACGSGNSGSGTGGTGGGTAPTVPTGLSATPGNAQVGLSWSACASATAYHVKRATVSGGPYTQVSAPTATTFTDTSLTNGTKYYYVVSAANSAGESANSAEVSAMPVLAIPAVPTGLSATAGNAQVGLSWSASAGATAYHVKRATVSGGPYAQISAPTGTTFTDSGVTNGTKYYYVVSAVNASGESANSGEASATPQLGVPAAPGGLHATAGNAQVSLSWNVSSGATSYHVKRSTTSGSGYTTIASPATTTYSDTTVTNGTTYYYVVSALNGAGESANSSQASATPNSAPNITVTVNAGQTKAISPYIYGLNFYTGVTGAPPQLTLDRAGGNRWTAYNWENNYSNAGSDYLYENDNYMDSSTTPGDAVHKFISADQGLGMASVMTVQLQGLVSADGSGPVSTTSPPDMTRFKQVIDRRARSRPRPSPLRRTRPMPMFTWTSSCGR
jgi:fibronectin type 3 domain-containing protein